MLMRSSKPQTVGRRGVHLDIAGKRLNYWNDALLASLLGKQVYYRYDPEELSSVRIYDLEDRYIMTVPCDNTAVLEYGADKDRVKAAMGKVRQFEKITKASLEASIVPAIGKDTACDLILADAMRKKQGFTEPEPPKVVQMQRVTETPLIGEAVGCNIDFERMNKNAYKKNGGKDK